MNKYASFYLTFSLSLFFLLLPSGVRLLSSSTDLTAVCGWVTSREKKIIFFFFELEFKVTCLGRFVFCF